MGSDHKLFLTPGPLHMLFPVLGIFLPPYTPFHPWRLILPMANLL